MQVLQAVQKEAKAGAILASKKKVMFSFFSCSDIEGHWFESIHAKVLSGAFAATSVATFERHPCIVRGAKIDFMQSVGCVTLAWPRPACLSESTHASWADGHDGRSRNCVLSDSLNQNLQLICRELTSAQDVAQKVDGNANQQFKELSLSMMSARNNLLR